jgi:isocitrate dehydrogenase (NAD+)
MLGHLGHEPEAKRLRAAIVETMEARDRVTPDIGGTGSTMDFARAIAERLTA